MAAPATASLANSWRAPDALAVPRKLAYRSGAIRRFIAIHACRIVLSPGIIFIALADFTQTQQLPLVQQLLLPAA
jgi:hypothetical protein